MDIQTILTLSFLGFTLAAPLGPVNAEMIKKALASKDGWILGAITGIGALTGDLLIAMTVLFIGAEFLASYLAIISVKVILLSANVFILGYIGYKSLRSEITEVKAEESVQRTHFRQYSVGFVIVVTSPWSYAWWASFGPLMLATGIPLGTFVDRLIATAFFLLGIIIWIALFNTALRVSHEFASPKVLRIITSVSALVIIGFAIYFVFNIICILGGFCLFNFPG